MLNGKRKINHHAGEHKTRRNCAHSTIELVVSLVLLVPIVLLFLHIGILVVSSSENAALCRAAARAAAQVLPVQSPVRAAQVIDFDRSTRKSRFASAITLKECKNNAVLPGPEGGIVSGSVTVTTVATVGPFLNNKALNFGLPQSFEASETFPYSVVVPPQHQAALDR